MLVRYLDRLGTFAGAVIVLRHAGLGENIDPLLEAQTAGRTDRSSANAVIVAFVSSDLIEEGARVYLF
jgi:hypothetical protein